MADRSHAQSIRDTIALAQYCETLGYARFWVSEHHNHPTIAGTAPEILMAGIAAKTQTIRVGSAGVMLPHYSPLKVAEQFRVLEAIAPDVSISVWTCARLRRPHCVRPQSARQRAASDVPHDVRDLMAWVSGAPLPEGHPFAAIKAFPLGETSPEVWVLGSSDYGAQVAATSACRTRSLVLHRRQGRARGAEPLPPAL